MLKILTWLINSKKNKKTENASFTAMMVMLITVIIIGIMYAFLV